MRVISLFFCYLLSITMVQAQSEFGGLWQGSYSFDSSLQNVEITEFYLHFTNDEKINGFGALYQKGSGVDGDIYTKWRIQGTITTEGVRYKVSSIYHNKGGQEICQRDCYLTHSTENDFDVLTGKCYPTGYKFANDGSTLVPKDDCTEISLKLYKRTQESEVITEDEIDLLKRAYSNFDVTIAEETPKEMETDISVAPTQQPTPQNQTITFDINSQGMANVMNLPPTNTTTNSNDKKVIEKIDEAPKPTQAPAKTASTAKPSTPKAATKTASERVEKTPAKTKAKRSPVKKTKYKSRSKKSNKKRNKTYKASQKKYAQRAKSVPANCAKMK